jgi:hypothetical protein
MMLSRKAGAYHRRTMKKIFFGRNQGVNKSTGHGDKEDSPKSHMD